MMRNPLQLAFRVLLVFYAALCASVSAAEEAEEPSAGQSRQGYAKGDLVPVSCLNRTIDTGEHITDSHGNLQYVPFPICNETSSSLAFPFATPQTQTCTIESLPDELYHLLEFFVHNDVPLTCRVPTYSLSQPNTPQNPSSSDDATLWTSFTIALQGTLQYSHIHLHTTINTIFHTYPTYTKDLPFNTDKSRFLAAAAYSLPNSTSTTRPVEGTKIIRAEPLVLSFNIGWIEGSLLPGMASRPAMKVTDHGVGFTLLSFFALAASAGVGAMAMLVYERRKSGRTMNGLLGGNTGGTSSTRTGNGYATGYGGYGGYALGKRD